jgi:hypothetical protein
MYPYVAPHTSKIHTLITLGIRHRNKPLVLKARQRLPRGFDSHRQLHSKARLGYGGDAPKPKLMNASDDRKGPMPEIHGIGRFL